MNKLKKLKQSETITLFQFLQMEDYTMKHEKTIYEKISLQILKLTDEELECGIDLKSLMEENGFIINIDFEDYEIEPGNYYLGRRTCFYDVKSKKFHLNLCCRDIKDAKELMALTILDKRLSLLENPKRKTKKFQDNVYRKTPVLVPNNTFVRFDTIYSDEGESFIRYQFNKTERQVSLVDLTCLLVPFNKNERVPFIRDMPFNIRLKLRAFLNCLVMNEEVLDTCIMDNDIGNPFRAISNVLLLNSFWSFCSLFMDLNA